MPETTMSYTETLTVTSCWCGIHVAIPDNLYRYVRNHKNKAVYCPLGHEFVFSDSFEEMLARERLNHKATLGLLHHEEKAHAATKGHMTRLRKRVEAGVCPHCHRHFANVERHMQTKHAKELQTNG